MTEDIDQETFNKIIASNDFESIKHNYPATTSNNYWPWYYAIKDRNFTLMTWLHKNRYEFDKELWEFIVRGEMDMMEWFYSHRYDFGVSVWNQPKNLEVMKWLYNHQAPWNNYAYFHAIETNNFEATKWLFKNGCPVNNEVMEFIAQNGNLDAFKWLRKKGCEFNIISCLEASRENKPFHDHLLDILDGCLSTSTI